METAVAVTVGGHHTCGRESAGTVECWGYNYYGQLGDGGTTDQPEPVQVLGGPYEAITAGWYTTCGVTPAGETE